MTIPNNLFRWRYTATAGDTTFQYTNKILVDADLAVYLNDTLKTLDTDYTVTSAGEPTGGNVVFAMGLAEDDDVLITKDGVDFTQDTDYVENDSFPAEAHEDALDKLTLLCQKIWDYVRRSVKVPITSSLIDLEFPDPEAGTVIAWNGSEDGFMNVTLSGIGGISDEAYSSTTWDGVADVAPSQNAVRDKIETLAASGANADITSMTGLDDDGIPLAKVDGAAASGANADITSMTGLNDDGIPVYKTALSMSDLYGCELSNGTDSDHDIDISAGQRRDTANGYNLVLAATLTKQIDAAFAAGDDAGGMFTGSVANSTWYHVHLIRKDSDGTIDAGFDTSSTAANIPAGYTAYRRLGAVLTDGSANILAFIQTGNEFQWVTPILDINDENTVTTRATAAISSPPSFKCLAKLNVYWNPAGPTRYCYVCDPDTTDLAPTGIETPLSSLGVDTVAASTAQIEVMTNTSSQIAYRTGESGRAFRAATLGYVDRRMP